MVTHDQEEALTMADRVVIMRDGRLEQVGTPEEIYSRPTSRFVASFIGACNFLHGSVTGQAADKLHVQLGSGGRAVVPSSRDGRKDVLISVRPEAVALNALEADATTSDSGTPATVQQVVYRGQATHVHMALDDGAPFVAFVPNRQAIQARSTFSVGDRVWASWSPNSNWAVTDA
jgi:putative spermidine/putrescine transport system ATP-binding protein/spermidine/putrescine transport system ATP-binding protein